MEKIQRQIESVWKETMTVEDKKRFLETFLQEEAAWKATLEEAYYNDIASGAQYLPAERSEKILKQLHDRLQPAGADRLPQEQGKVVRFSFFRKWSAAAAVLLLLVAGYYFHLQQSGRPQSAIPSTGGVASQLRLESNDSAGSRTIQLDDGSVIVLEPGSAVRYYVPFIHGRRDISLVGQARFTVAKDSLRLFTVYANDIATTALGTQFTVSTLEKDKVAVRLFEGKVVVKSAGSGLTMKDVFLNPGEEFRIDRALRQFTVRRFDAQEATAGTPLVATAEMNNEKAAPAALEFRQEPLTSVLTAIGKRYKVRFIYNEEILQNEQVTGKFLPSDSLETVLSILGSVNGLSFSKQGSSITVSLIP